jgi:hypothetical protein
VIKAVNFPNMGTWVDDAQMRVWLNRLPDFGVEYVCFDPAYRMDALTSNSIYWDGQYCCTDAQLVSYIQMAKAAGLKIILKPIIDVVGAWRGDAAPTNWTSWFASWTTMVLNYASIAQAQGAEIFVFGTESVTAEHQTDLFAALIAAIRGVYSGTLTYAASRLHYRLADCPFETSLDMVGVAWYPPITDIPRFVTLAQLAAGWVQYTNAFNAWATETGKQIFLAEFGSIPVQGCNQFPWETIQEYAIGQPNDYPEQADFYQTALDSWASVPSLAGICLWGVNSYDVFGEVNKKMNPFGHVAGEVLRMRWGGKTGGWYTP